MPDESKILRQANYVTMADIDVLAYTSRICGTSIKQKRRKNRALDLSPRITSLRDLRATVSKLNELSPGQRAKKAKKAKNH